MSSNPSLSLLRLTSRCRCWALVLILSTTSSHAFGQSAPDAARGDTVTWSQLVNDTTYLVVRIDPQRLDVAGLAELFGKQAMWLAADLPYTESQPLLRLWLPRDQVNRSDDMSAKLRTWRFGTPDVEGEFLRYSFYLPGRTTRPATATSAALTAERTHLRDALSATADAPLQCIIIPPEYLRTTLRDLMPELPSRLGGGATSVLTDGLLWASLTMERNASGAMLKIQSASPAAAERLAERLPDLVMRISHLLTLTNQRPVLIDMVKPEIQNDQILVKIDAEHAVAAWELAVQRAIKQAASLSSQQQLHEIILAFHKFHDVHGQFPPLAKGRDEHGKPLLSWRVHLLPHLGEADLYAQFRLDEPWDSEHNLPLVEKIPEVFISPSVPLGRTVLLAPVGENTISGGSEPSAFRSITDGTSNTAMIVAVKPERAVPWTAPKDYAFDPNDPGAGLAQDVAGHFLMAAADGFVHQVPGDRTAQTLLRLFQMNDGHPVQW